MRKIYKALGLTVFLALPGVSVAQYCAGGPTSTADSNIETVDIAGENATAITYLGCPGVTGVEDQTAQSVDLNVGAAYSLDVTFGSCGGNYGGAGQAWIDFNQDDVFDPATESVGSSTGTPGTAPWNAVVTFNFTVPNTAAGGVTRLRVMQREGGFIPLDPCGSYSWGSVIDFSVNLILPPTPPTPLQDPTPPTCALGTSLTLPGAPDPGLTWYWQVSATGTDMANDGTNPWVVFANGTYYARAYDAVLDVWSDASSVTVSNFPLATAPPAPVAAANPACVPGTELTVPGTPGVDVTWYWQGTNSTGTSLATDAANPFTVTSSGTYYVAAFDASTSCWSDAVGTAVVVNTTIPDAPAAVQASYAYCGNAATMEIEAVPSVVGCSPSDIEVTISSAGWGEGTTWTLTDNGGAVVLSGGTYGNGFSDTQTLNGAANGPYLLSIVSTVGDNSPNYSVSVDGTVVESGVAPPNTTTTVGPLPCSEIVADVEWYSASVGGDFLGTGAILNALGTTVLPVAANGTYQFYAASLLDGCESATRTLVEVVVTEVSVELIPVDETCVNYADGSFTLGTVLCGVAPFEYSIDGGAFDATIPTDLVGGTYSVVVRDDLGNESAPISVVIGTTATVIPGNPIAGTTDYFACTGATSLLIGDIQLPGTTSLTTTLAGGNGCTGGAMFDLVATSGNITVTSLDIVPGSTGAQTVNVYTKSGTYAGFQTDAASWTLLGAYPITGTTGTVVNIDVDDFTINQGDVTGVYVNYDAQYTTVAPGTNYTDGNLTIEVGSGLCDQFDIVNTPRGFNGSVYYEVSVPSSSSPADVFWYDALTGGTLLGTGDDLESVGTSLIANPAAAGTYEFFAYANLDGCFSEEGALVTVNVTDVNVTLTPIAASCNNGPSGSFILASTECGVAPLTFSVDGGAFGPIPNDLLPGEHTVVVMDDTGSESAEYTILIPDADAPTDLLIVEAFEDGADISWTAGALETDWNIEWGLPGFVPGTGDEIGSATVNTLNYVITGLNDNELYDVYVSANCGAGSTAGEWTGNSFLTLCGVFTSLPFVETFENNSDTRDCWSNEYEVGTTNWTYNTGSSGGAISTAFEGTLNARFVSLNATNEPITKLVSPRFDFSGQDSVAVTFAYAQQDFAGDQNTTKVYSAGPSGVWTEIADYTANVSAWTVDTLFVADTTVQIAFEGINNWGYANVIDDVNVFPCTLNAGVDGQEDVCRLDGMFDLSTIVTLGETFGAWEFPSNPTILSGSMVDVSTLPSGSYDFYYIVRTPCDVDTTTATLTIFPPSSAGNDGTILACRNQPINLFDGLNGNLDLGGVWYDPSDSPLTGALETTSNIPGSFNYLYITSNGVCPADTSLVEVIVDADCDHLSLGGEEFTEMTVFPNPATDVLNIEMSSNAGAMTIEMSDVNGRIVLTDVSALADTESATLSIAHLEKGVYTLRIFSAEGQRTFKIVKQ